VRITPEAVAVTLDIAGLGSRMIALLVDTLIQFGILLAAGFLVANAASGTASVIALSVVAFVALWCYFPLFEALWSGRTPGKSTQRLRVIRTDGQPVSFAAVMVRNLVRIVDLLPGTYVIGVISIVLTRRSQRLGDLAAGTIVIRDRPAPTPRPLDLASLSPSGVSPPSAIDTAALTERDVSLIRSYLERRRSLPEEIRADLAGKLARAVRQKVGSVWSEGLDDEAVLVAAMRAYRERFNPAPDRPDLQPS